MGKIELVSKTKQQIKTWLNYTTLISNETRTIATSCCYYFVERGRYFLRVDRKYHQTYDLHPGPLQSREDLYNMFLLMCGCVLL